MASEDFADSTDPVETLRRVNLYRELWQDVRRGSTGTLFFGFLMLAIWYGAFGVRSDYGAFSLVYLTLGCLEVAVGLLNRFSPSPEGVFFDGVVLILFGTATLARQLLIWQGMMRGDVNAISLMFGGYWLWHGYLQLQTYWQLRLDFPHRPQPEHLRWFEDLLREIRQGDPKSDPSILDLDTTPPIQVKLLGKLVFVLMPESADLFILRDNEFTITPAPAEAETPVPMATVWISEIGEFECPLDPVNWSNYKNWANSTRDASC